MSSSEKIAIAAHLHVLLRRKTGRVTDTEWMASNREYAHEVARLARVKAAEGGHAELGVWADKLEEIMGSSSPRPLAKTVPAATKESSVPDMIAEGAAAEPGFAESMRDSSFGDSQMPNDAAQRQTAPRYIKGLR